jgi:Barstar (barnase inhibitor)
MPEALHAQDVDDRDFLIPDYGVHERKGVDIAGLLATLRGGDWPTFTLAGAPKDWDGFVASIKAVLPLDPPIERGIWDAVYDSLWEGIHMLNAEKVVIVWPGSDRLRKGDPLAYEKAIDLFTVLVFSLADPKFTVDHVTRVLVLLA